MTGLQATHDCTPIGTNIYLAAAFILLICHATLVQSQNINSSNSNSMVADFDWTMRDRLIDKNNDGRIDTTFFPITDHQPDSFRVVFNAGASTQPISVYQWYVDTADVVEVTEIDTFAYDFPAEGTYSVTLITIDPTGMRTSVTKEVIVQDWVILALGDSYASGGGNPDRSIPPQDFEDLNAALVVLADELDNYNLKIEEVASAQAVFDAAVQDLLTKEVNLQITIDQANIIRARRDAIIRAQAVLNAAIIHRNDACNPLNFPPTPILCVQAEQQVVAARTAVNTARAALLTELAKLGWETLLDQLNQIETALQALIQPLQEAVDTARALKDLALAKLNAAIALRDLTLAALNGAQEAYHLDFEEMKAKVKWNQNGHRSMYSGLTQAALMVEKADPRTSVTLFHGARSGAKIDGVKDKGGQIQNVIESIGDREVDALLISIGGNDVGFSKVLQICMQEEPCFDPGPGPDIAESIETLCGQLVDIPISAQLESLIGDRHPFFECKEFLENLPRGNAQEIFTGYLEVLPAKYNSLQDSLQVKFKEDNWYADRLYITKYPNALRNDLGEFCAWSWNLEAKDQLHQLPGLSLPEMMVAEGWLNQLNDAIDAASVKNGWNLVDFLDESKYDKFETHGYCADENWTVRIAESFMTQGDHNGIAHPTGEGHEVYARHVFAALMEDFYDDQGNARPPKEVSPSSIKEIEEILPETFTLSQNYPNPFNPSTTIEFSLPNQDFVEIKLYDTLGKEVAVLISEHLNTGKHQFRFDASHLASGTYIYKIKVGTFEQSRKMLLLR